MRVAIFGANGQLGSDLVRAGAESGREVVPLGRPLLDAADLPGTQARLADLSFDAAVNCVAATRVDDCDADPAWAVTVNAGFAAFAARECARRNARLVHVSTDYVFGAGPERAPISETAPRAPVNVYGATKALGEDWARLDHEDVLVVRVAALFGVAGASGKGGNFVETMLRLAREGGRLRVVDDQRTVPTSTADAARAIWGLLDKGSPAGVWHVANAGEASWCEFARAILAEAGVNAEVEAVSTAEFPTSARRPAYTVLDTAKASAVLGPFPHWRDALGRYLRATGHAAGQL